MAKEDNKPETVTLLGKECQAIRKTDGTDKVVMRSGDFAEILASHGVTKEVRDVVKKADDAIAEEVVKFQSERLLKLNKGKKEDAEGFVKKSIVTLGQGSGAMEFELRPIVRHTGKDIKTGEPYTTVKYGQIRATKLYQFGAELRKDGGVLDKVEAEFTKVYGGKK